jgi:hypothetical protein
MQKQLSTVKNIPKIVSKNYFLLRQSSGKKIANHKIERNKKVSFSYYKDNSFIQYL